MQSTSITFILDDRENFDSNKLPTPAKPSLRMRLFCDEKKREALRSLLESNEKDDKHQRASSSSSSTNNVWLDKSDLNRLKRKASDVISLDDSL